VSSYNNPNTNLHLDTVLGIKYKITPIISISTETYVYPFYSIQVKDYKYPDSPHDNKKELHEYSTINLSPPLYINLTFRKMKLY